MINIVHHNADQLFEQVSHLIAEARSHVARAVNSAMVTTYYEIGRHIVENEQNGQQRAQYGKQVLQELSARLTAEFGKGWSVETLKKCRVLYKTYAPEIGSTAQLESNLVYTVDQIKLPEDANIYARQYMLCLPDKEVLQAKLREWILEAEE